MKDFHHGAVPSACKIGRRRQICETKNAAKPRSSGFGGIFFRRQRNSRIRIGAIIRTTTERNSAAITGADTINGSPFFYFSVLSFFQ